MGSPLSHETIKVCIELLDREIVHHAGELERLQTARKELTFLDAGFIREE